uniref:Uncharacterized protein n=1 Tax=Romanomermis culicivorax TaxID=13658 RepID=A0A915KQH3_ROMCU
MSIGLAEVATVTSLVGAGKRTNVKRPWASINFKNLRGTPMPPLVVTGFIIVPLGLLPSGRACVIL